MKDYYKLLVELSLQQCKKDDYIDSQKVKIHNAAARKIARLENELLQQNNRAETILMLLNHEDERVKLNAAAICSRANILVDQAVFVLEQIMCNSQDSTFCFAAEILLKRLKS